MAYKICSLFWLKTEQLLKIEIIIWIFHYCIILLSSLSFVSPSIPNSDMFQGSGSNETALVTTVLGLQLWLTEKHFLEGKVWGSWGDIAGDIKDQEIFSYFLFQLLVSCKAFISDIYNMSSNSYTVGR